MALTFDIEGFGDLAHKVVNWSIVEDATTLVPGSGGGVGACTFTLGPDVDAKRLARRAFDFEETGRGTTQGIVTVASGNAISTTVNGTNRMQALVTNVQADPFAGTLQAALTYYFSLAGITEPFYIDAALSSVSVIAQGFDGALWDFLSKELAPAYAFEMAFVSDRIVVRTLLQREVVTYRDTAPPTWGQDFGQLAQKVRVSWYELASRTNIIVYPSTEGWTEDADIISVDAGEQLELELEIDTSLSSIQQPVPVDYVWRQTNDSVYAVVGSDNLPIPAAQWVGMGGSVSVEIGADTRTIILRVNAPTSEQYAPYRLAMSDGSGDYSSLRIRGSGVTSVKHEIEAETGVTPAQSSTEVGIEVDSRAIRTISQAYDILAYALAPYMDGSQTLSVTSGGVHKVGDSGAYSVVSVGEFEDMLQFSGKTVGEVEDWLVANGYDTVGEVEDWLASLAALEFQNQAFGNVAGARVLHEDCMYRITSATTTRATVSYQALEHTTVGDVEDEFDGMTVGQIEDMLAGATVGEVNTAPLRRDWT